MRGYIQNVLGCGVVFLNFVWQSIRKPDNFPHFLTFGATVALVVFAYYAWDEATRGTSAIQGQLSVMRAKERAFVYFTNINPVPYPQGVPVNWNFAVGLTNVGNIPARKVSAKYSCPNVVAGDPPPDFASARWVTFNLPTVIEPKQPLDKLWGCNMPASEIESAKRGDRRIFIFLQVEYLDGVMPVTRQTQMSRVVQFTPDETITFVPVGPHNCSDDDCSN